MGYYLISFGASLSMSYIAERKYKKEKYKEGHLVAALAILIVCMLAGVRAASVGTDVNYYVIPYIERVSWYPNFSIYMKNIPIEPLFGILCFINGKLFENTFFVLFICQLFTVLPLYATFYHYRDKLSITFAYAIYLLLFYNMSLCIIRQFVSMSLILYAFCCCENNKYKRIFILVSAVLFHYTGLLFIVLYLICQITSRLKYSILSKLLLIIILGVVLVALPFLLKVFANTFGTMANKYYEIYLSKLDSGGGISIIETSFRLLLFAIPYALSIRSNDKWESENLFLLLIGLIFSAFAVVSEYMLRISCFNNIFYCLTIPYSIKHISKKSRFTYECIIIAICFAYWYIIYYLWNNFETFPYMIWRN